MLEMLALSVSIGFVLGLVSGLIPGIHTNNFALILLALSEYRHRCDHSCELNRTHLLEHHPCRVSRRA